MAAKVVVDQEDEEKGISLKSAGVFCSTYVLLLRSNTAIIGAQQQGANSAL